MLVSLSLVILPLLDTFAHLVHLTLVSELPLSNSTRRKGRRARRFAACNRRTPHPREGGAISSLSSNGEPNKKNSTLFSSNSNSNETFSPPLQNHSHGRVPDARPLRLHPPAAQGVGQGRPAHAERQDAQGGRRPPRRGTVVELRCFMQFVRFPLSLAIARRRGGNCSSKACEVAGKEKAKRSKREATASDQSLRRPIAFSSSALTTPPHPRYPFDLSQQPQPQPQPQQQQQLPTHDDDRRPPSPWPPTTPRASTPSTRSPGAPSATPWATSPWPPTRSRPLGSTPSRFERGAFSLAMRSFDP